MLEKILKKYNITPDTKNHSYDYLYSSIISVMKEYSEERIEEFMNSSMKDIDPKSYKIGVSDGKFDTVELIEESLMDENYIKENYDEGTLDNEFIRGIRFQRDKIQEAAINIRWDDLEGCGLDKPLDPIEP